MTCQINYILTFFLKKAQKGGVVLHKALGVMEGTLEPHTWVGISVLAPTS